MRNINVVQQNNSFIHADYNETAFRHDRADLLREDRIEAEMAQAADDNAMGKQVQLSVGNWVVIKKYDSVAEAQEANSLNTVLWWVGKVSKLFSNDEIAADLSLEGKFTVRWHGCRQGTNGFVNPAKPVAPLYVQNPETRASSPMYEVVDIASIIMIGGIEQNKKKTLTVKTLDAIAEHPQAAYKRRNAKRVSRNKNSRVVVSRKRVRK